MSAARFSAVIIVEPELLQSYLAKKIQLWFKKATQNKPLFTIVGVRYEELPECLKTDEVKPNLRTVSHRNLEHVRSFSSTLVACRDTWYYRQVHHLVSNYTFTNYWAAVPGIWTKSTAKHPGVDGAYWRMVCSAPFIEPPTQEVLAAAWRDFAFTTQRTIPRCAHYLRSSSLISSISLRSSAARELRWMPATLGPAKPMSPAPWDESSTAPSSPLPPRL